MYRPLRRLGALLAALMLSGSLHASIDTYTFDTPEQEALFRQLVEELRCLVCQNQNIAASNAELAQDLRRITYEKISAGQNREQIVQYMVERYGDFVLYQPPMRKSTLLLWVGPFIGLLLAVIILARVIRGRNRAASLLTEDQRRRAEQLLAQDSDS